MNSLKTDRESGHVTLLYQRLAVSSLNEKTIKQHQRCIFYVLTGHSKYFLCIFALSYSMNMNLGSLNLATIILSVISDMKIATQI